MEKIRRDIKNKSIEGIYLFTGDEKYLIKQYEESFIKACLPGGRKDMGLSVFEGRGAAAESIAEAVDTPSFIGGNRLVLVKSSGLFTSKCKDDGEKIASYMTKLSGENDGAVLLFIEDDVDKRTKAYKAVSKYGKVTEFKPLTESETASWIVESFRKNGLMVSTRDSVHLVRLCGGSMEAVAKEIEKLSAYKIKGKITASDMDELCAGTPEAKIFGLIDAVAAKNRGQALKIYNELLSMKEQPIGILAMLGRQFGLILKSGLLAKKGAGEREIAETLKQHPYSIKVALSQSKKISDSVLKQAVLDSADCDVKIKTGLVGDRLGVEMLIIKYTG